MGCRTERGCQVIGSKSDKVLILLGSVFYYRYFDPIIILLDQNIYKVHHKLKVSMVCSCMTTSSFVIVALQKKKSHCVLI